ncbi:MAG TPA: UDP-glucose--hexose-1-phosphate uridylyltransferase [Candidatus Baltobacteraceae bacterium]|nr:UDP-glucose--hexose-1-phosphate uridylyltransferase [Candidatus Baltobacteraceae bacterium]
MTDWHTLPHRRFNPLTGEWVLVSPHRLERPWQGEVAASAPAARPAYDPHCYLCPGNERAGGKRNPRYQSTFAFDNDFPALLPDLAQERFSDGMLAAQSESGRCRVLCFSPRHDLDVAAMQPLQIREVVDAWAREYTALGSLPAVNAVTIFENRGAMMGASNPHPHCQIWAQSTVPSEQIKESNALAEYARRSGRCLLCEYAAQEIAAGERIVHANDHVVVVVPFWAVWPFEALVLPRRHVDSLERCASEERDAIADGIHVLTARYDRLFSAPFPYSMGWHQAPAGGGAHGEWHAHAHYFPPLLRSATVRKFMVGYEMLAEPQRDITAEEAARRLREIDPRA